MTADNNQSIYQSPDQHTNPNQLSSLQSSVQSPCVYNIPQPSVAIMGANLNLDLSPASIPSFAPLTNMSASHPQHQPQSKIVSQPSPTSSTIHHLGCMEPVTGVPMQQHACAPRTAAEKTGKDACSCQSAFPFTFPAMLFSTVFMGDKWLQFVQ